MSEVTAYQAFRKGVRRPGDRIDRIENLVGTGFPDTNCCFNGVEFWMEIKAPTEPKRPGTPLFGSNHKLSQDQKNWFLSQRNAAGLGFIYIETDKRRMLINGVHADRINESTVYGLLGIASWEASRRATKEDWERLRSLIIHGDA